MKERRDRTMRDMLEEMELEIAIRERFKYERHPEASVDGENPWDRQLFAEDES